MRVALGAIGQTVPETSLPWYQQFWDELFSPFQTDTTVLQQQTQAATGDISSAVSATGWIIVGVLGIVVLTLVETRK